MLGSNNISGLESFVSTGVRLHMFQLPPCEVWLANNQDFLARATHHDDELLQQVRIRLWHVWSRFTLPEDISDEDAQSLLFGWVHRIIHNLTIDEWRKRQTRRHHECPIDELGRRVPDRRHDQFQEGRDDELLLSTFFEELVGSSSELLPEQQLILREELQQLWSQLRPSERQIVWLLALGYTNDEAAHQLRIPIGTLKTRLFHMRHRIAALSQLRHQATKSLTLAHVA